MDKMNSREDKYEICKILSYKEGIDKIKGLIKDYDAVLIGDMPSHERNLLLKYCFSLGIRSYSVPKISDVLLRSSDELNLFDTCLLYTSKEGKARKEIGRSFATEKMLCGKALGVDWILP